MNYLYDKTKDKEVRSMEGITKIEIPEIEGLRDTFEGSIVTCGDTGTDKPNGCGC